MSAFRILVLATLAAMAVVACASNDQGDESDPAPTGSTTDPTSPDSTDPTQPPGEPEADSSLSWARAPHDEAVLGGDSDQVMSAVVAGGPGFIAVGRDDSITPRAAAVWTSENGLAWSRVPHDDGVFGPDGQPLMNDVTAGGPGFVAVGQGSRGGDRFAVVWTSPDGLTWTRIPHDDATFTGDDGSWMTSVTAGGPGLVAVGATGFDDQNATVWTSVDGLVWTRIESPAFGGPGSQAMLSVTAGGPGLVAVGWELDLVEFEMDAAVWTSADGSTWTRVESDAFGGDDNQDMSDVTVGGPGLVAVGVDWDSDLPPDAAVWTSVDGATWSRVSGELVFGGQSTQQMFGVIAGGPGLVAVGVSIVDDVFAHEAAVWTSTDGLSWSREPHDEEVFGGDDDQDMFDVAVSGDLIVVVGSAGPAGDADSTAWLANRG